MVGPWFSVGFRVTLSGKWHGSSSSCDITARIVIGATSACIFQQCKVLLSCLGNVSRCPVDNYLIFMN